MSQLSVPPPVLPLRPHSGGASDKEGEGGGRRQESTCVHSTHRCLCHTPGLLLPVLSSVIWPLPVCNFTKYKLCILKLFRRWTLHTNKISQSLPYLQVMQHNWSLDFFVAHFIQTILETFLLSHESFQISNLFQAHYFPTLFFVTAPRIFLKLPNIFCHCENPINCERVIMGVKTFHLAEKLKSYES